jgi:2-alkyl-3-oxoalkanoate reductase
MRVLVTGATGFVGRHLVDALRARGHQVRALHRPQTVPDLPTGVEPVSMDLRAPDGLAAALEGVDVVIHAAAAKSGDLHDQFAGTVTTTQHLLAAMRATGVRRLVLVSSFAVYDQAALPSGGLLDEDAPLRDPARTNDPYGATKRLQEELVEEVAAAEGWSVVVARPGAVYGPGELWTGRLGSQARDGRIWLCVGDDAELPMTEVGNCADALAHLADHVAGQDGPGLLRVNLVDDERPTQASYRAALLERVDAPDRVVVLPWRLVHLVLWLLHALDRSLGSPLRLPRALQFEAAMARWKPLRFTNRRLRELGWTQPVPWPATLDRATEGALRTGAGSWPTG